MNQRNCQRFVILFITCLSSHFASAQLNTGFYTGNILLKNGQNLNGLIKNEPISRMNYKVNFKANAEEKKFTEYDTSTVAAVKISNGEVYELLRFKSDDMEDSMAVLGKLMVKGKLRLYKISVKAKTFFLIKSNDKVYCLQDDEQISSFSVEEIKHNFKKQVDTALMHSSSFVAQINNLSFNEKDFIQIVSNYNTAANAGNEILQIKVEHSNFIIFSLGGGSKGKDDNEIYLSGMFRVYFPRVSKGTSLNMGINYFHEKYVAPQATYGYYTDHTSDLISIPVQFQENLLNRNIRPYVFAGFKVSYVKDVDQYGTSPIGPGFQSNFGIGLLFGAGIEWNVYKNFIVKGEFRYENYVHPILFGIAYSFKTK